ncbi:MAG: phosphate ABC transporter substrate-binding protein [Parvularcula sp.]
MFLPKSLHGCTRSGLWIAVACGLAVASCSHEHTSNVTISGSSTVLPVVSQAAEEYVDSHPDVRIIVNAGGSGVGVNQLGEGQTDIGMMSRNIRESEYEKYADAKLQTHIIGRDAVVPVVSSEIYDAGLTALHIDQLKDIYTGEVSNWSELGGPDREILVIDKEASRGTRQVFMEVVLGDGMAKAAGADLVLGSNNEEQTAIAQSDSAVGMLSNGWLNDDVRGLSIIMADGTVVEPSLENIRNGSFPIVRDLLLVSRADISEPALAFIDYVQGPEGQDIVEKTGYIRVK